MYDRLRLKLIIALVAILASPGAQAALVTKTYKNSSDITELFLWSADPAGMTFAGVDLSDKNLAAWTTALNLGDRLVLEGPKVKKGKKAGKFNIEFDYSVVPFTFQFAEVLLMMSALAFMGVAARKGSPSDSAASRSEP